MTTPQQARDLADRMRMATDEQLKDALRSLSDQIEALTAERNAVLQQAQLWKQEARTQASIVRECYQTCTGSTGEPGDWNGADPVRALAAERDSYKKDAQRYIKRYSHYHYFGEGRNCASCGFDVTDPSHIRAAIKGAAT